MSFEPRYAIVTASDSGIGKATAVRLRRAGGLDVGITWHTDSAVGAEDTAAEVRSSMARQAVGRSAGHHRSAELFRRDRPDDRPTWVGWTSSSTTRAPGGAELLVDTATSTSGAG